MAPNPRERRTLLDLLEHAQLAYLLTRFPRSQVLDDRGDVARLDDALARMRAAAKQVPARIREAHPMVRWDVIDGTPADAEAAWAAAKRAAPTVLRELAPLLADTPEGAFLVRLPESAKGKTRATSRPAPGRPARASRRPGRAGRST